MTENYFSFQNAKFFYRDWDVENAKRVIVLIHGMGEHSGRYDHVAKFFNQYGYAVVAIDHYGHGLSDGKRGTMPSFDFLLNYVEAFIEEAQKKHPNADLILYGHSMGGGTALNYLLRKNNPFKAAIITSPWLTLAKPAPAVKAFAAKVLCKLLPNLALSSELDASRISRDPQVVKTYLADPLVHDKISPGFFIPFEQAGLWAIENASKLKTKTLLMHGTADEITNINSSIQVSKAAESAVTFKSWEGNYHELHNDLQKQEVLEAMLDWLSGTLLAVK